MLLITCGVPTRLTTVMFICLYHTSETVILQHAEFWCFLWI